MVKINHQLGYDMSVGKLFVPLDFVPLSLSGIYHNMTHQMI